MKKIIKIGLYNPYLDTLGGGEKHILSILDVLVGNGAEATIFWKKNLTKEIKSRFRFKSVDSWSWSSKKILQFDYFFYVTDGSYFFSFAKKNFVFCMVPDKNLYKLNLINRLKLWNYEFISNSPYTTKWLTKWGINPITIPPYIDKELFMNSSVKKEKLILSVGRFFPHLHSKNQEKIIATFQKLKTKNSLFKDYKLVLAGGLKKEDRNYFDKLRSLAKNYSDVIFKPNITLNELYRLYGLSTYFWHFTGLGVDENKHPKQVEHFGIAPLEAAASSCLIFCHNSGGPKEIFSDKKTGFLFNSEEELIQKIINAEINPSIKEEITSQSKLMVEKVYNYEVFAKRVKNIL